jgi:hypothetical protein
MMYALRIGLGAACCMLLACSGSSTHTDANDAGVVAEERPDPKPWPDQSPPADEGPSAQLYAQDSLPYFDIELSSTSLAALRENPRTYATGTFRYGDEVIENVGIRLRGHSSFRSIDQKAGFKIKFDAFVPGQRFRGLKRLTLNNAAGDPSYIAERLSYFVFRAGNVVAPRANSAVVSVNGEPYGVYANVEAIDKTFLARWFADNGGNLYEAEFADVRPGAVPRCAMSHDTDCFDLETNEDDDDWSDLENLFSALSSSTFSTVGQLQYYFDLDRFLRYCAMEVLVNQFDGYGYGSPDLPANNYRIYHDPSVGRFSLIPWGMDHSMKPLPIDSDRHVYFGGTSTYLLFYCLADEACRDRYRSILLETALLYESLNLRQIAGAMQLQISEVVAQDPRVGISNGDFTAAVQRVLDTVDTRAERVRADIEGGL